MARHDSGSRRRVRGDSDEDYDGNSIVDRAAGRAENGGAGGGGGGGGPRLQSSPHIGVTKVRQAQVMRASTLIPATVYVSESSICWRRHISLFLRAHKPREHNELLLWPQVQEDWEVGGPHMAVEGIRSGEPEEGSPSPPGVIQ